MLIRTKANYTGRMIGAQSTRQVPWLQATLQLSKALTSLTSPSPSWDTPLSPISCKTIRKITKTTRQSSSATNPFQTYTMRRLSKPGHRPVITPWHTKMLWKVRPLICGGPQLQQVGTEILWRIIWQQYFTQNETLCRTVHTWVPTFRIRGL
jgi:hypothetical protein